MTNKEPMTELFDADIDRVDLVGAAANGRKFLLAKSSQLVPADTVRELVKAAEHTALDTALDTVAKAGRALSAANEKKLRDAAEQISAVLAALPTNPDTPVSKEQAPMAEENQAPAEAETVEKTVDPEQQPETDIAAPAEEVVKSADEHLAEVAKADGLIAVYDATGALVGVVKPNAITPVEGPGTTDPDDDGDSVEDTDGDGDGALPAPVEEAAETLTEADGANQIDTDATPVEEAAADPAAASDEDDDDEDSRVIPGTNTVQSPLTKTATAAETDLAAVLKEALTPIAEKLAETAQLADVVKALEERVEKFGASPDNRNLPRFHGATGSNAGPVQHGEAPVDALEPLKKALADAEQAGDPVAIHKANADLLFESVKARFESPLH